MLDFEHAVPIQDATLWPHLSFTRNLTVGAFGWAQSAGLRQSLLQLQHEDGELISRVLHEQAQRPKVFDLDAADRRHIDIGQRTVVRTEQGEVEVEVPEREQEEEQPAPEGQTAEREMRASIRVQANVAQLSL